MAAQAASPDTQGSPGKMGQVLVFLVMTLFAMGAGYGASVVLQNMQAQSLIEDQATDAAGHGEAATAAAGGHGSETPASGHGSSAHDETPVPPGSLVTMEIPAIITNLAAPRETWIRLELAVRFVGNPSPQLIEDIHQDLLAFVRTMRLEQIEGPSGFLHFKSDLAERAAIRSGGAARSVLVKVLLFE